jgi:hypothetical protein
VLGQQSGQISILAEMQQVLLMEGVNFVICVFLDEIGMDDVWFRLVAAALECFDAVEGETTG